MEVIFEDLDESTCGWDNGTILVNRYEHKIDQKAIVVSNHSKTKWRLLWLTPEKDSFFELSDLEFNSVEDLHKRFHSDDCYKLHKYNGDVTIKL